MPSVVENPAREAVARVATLIARPDATDALVDVLARAEADIPEARVETLEEGRAVDLLFEATEPEAHAIGGLLEAIVADSPVDVVVQTLAFRRKRLLVADMDSTMIGQECIDELAGMVGLKPHVAAITERAMRGEIAFEPALRERVALLKGLPLSVIDTLLAERITLTPGATAFIRTMRAHGAYTALVSGGFTHFTGPIAAKIGFDENRANRLQHADGVLIGTVEEPILGQEAKLSALLELSNRLRLAREETVAVGDGANDLAMIRAAGLGVAYHAKPKVAAEASARIKSGDLTALLYAQGFNRAEWVE